MRINTADGGAQRNGTPRSPMAKLRGRGRGGLSRRPLSRRRLFGVNEGGGRRFWGAEKIRTGGGGCCVPTRFQTFSRHIGARLAGSSVDQSPAAQCCHYAKALCEAPSLLRHSYETNFLTAFLEKRKFILVVSKKTLSVTLIG